ncbi:MAG: hypothetical protein HC942_27875 [Microcoleus sp. SU_5_6]|nr:hypothetical protein [Microcoleus sp. SU_5_6]
MNAGCAQIFTKANILKTAFVANARGTATAICWGRGMGRSRIALAAD